MSCPAQDRGLSKGIKYSYTLFGVGEAPGDALTLNPRPAKLVALEKPCDLVAFA
jgi:hypothetical protein